MAEIYVEIERVVKSNCTVADGMRAVVERCARDHPHPDWERFARLDLATDLDHLREWLLDAFSTPPDEEDDGIWFGLFNPVYDGETAADMRVSASPYDPESAGDWASEVGWRPSNECARSRVLKTIVDIAYGGEGLGFDDEAEGGDLLGNDAEYPLCLAYATLAVRHLATELHPLLFLGNAHRRLLFVGFDSGDYICIGALTDAGLQFSRDSFEFVVDS